MLEDYGISKGIKVILLGVGSGYFRKHFDNHIVHFSTNINLLQNGEKVIYRYDHTCRDTTIPTAFNQVTELLAQNLVGYALEQWNMEIKGISFKRYSVDVSVQDLEDQELLGLLEKAVRRMCLSIINVYHVRKGNPYFYQNKNTEVEYELLPRSTVSSAILPNTYIQMTELEKAKICIEISNLLGVEDVQVQPDSINLFIANAFAIPEYIDALVDQVDNIIRRNWTPNILFTSERSLNLNTLVTDSQ
jgi:hypothetical protein